MLTFIVTHLIMGLLLGSWLRVGSLFAAFFIVVLEGVLAAQVGVLIPAYFLILAGIFALQLGYVSASCLKGYYRRSPEHALKPLLPAK